MSVTVVENIARVLLARLETLATANNGYNTRAKEVIRPERLGGWTPKDLQIVLTQGAAEEVPDLSYPGNPPAVAIRQTFNIRCHVIPSERSTTPVETIINTFSSDVRKCVTSPTSWHQFGGYSIDAEFTGREDIAADGGPDGFNMPIAILYRTSENDPYTVRA
jgi:hypothetical protein